MSITALYMFSGYRAVLEDDPRRAKINEAFCEGGELEAAYEMVAIATAVDTATAELQEEVGPGIWEYDVAEPLGAWVAGEAARGVAVDADAIVEKAVTMTAEWVNRGKHD